MLAIVQEIEPQTRVDKGREVLGVRGRCARSQYAANVHARVRLRLRMTQTIFAEVSEFATESVYLYERGRNGLRQTESDVNKTVEGRMLWQRQEAVPRKACWNVPST